jgi:hypothetical protein
MLGRARVSPHHTSQAAALHFSPAATARATDVRRMAESVSISLGAALYLCLLFSRYNHSQVTAGCLISVRSTDRNKERGEG